MLTSTSASVLSLTLLIATLLHGAAPTSADPLHAGSAGLALAKTSSPEVRRVIRNTAGTTSNWATVSSDEEGAAEGNNEATAGTSVDAGAVSVSVADHSFTPNKSTLPQGYSVTWKFNGPSRHTASDSSGMALFNSGPKPAGSSYTAAFVAAGTYPYKCNIHPSLMTGRLRVPVRASPRTGTTETTFAVTWSSKAPPTGYVFDVQMKSPGSTSYVAWEKGVTSTEATFVPDKGGGTYLFRARVRKPSVGKASAWSLPVSVEATSSPSVMTAERGDARSISSLFLGLNGNNIWRRPWNDPDFLVALKSFRPGALRYPGGTIGNYWDWNEGWFQPGGPWPGQPATRIDNTLGTFASAVDATSSVPVFVLNLLTYQGSIAAEPDNGEMISEQMRFLDAARAAGLPVRLVELGNEFDLHGPGVGNYDYEKRFPTGEDYALEANSWIAAVRSAFPDARIAAVGTDAGATSSDRRKAWNEKVLQSLSGADALTLHVYITVTNSDASPQSLLSLPYQRFQKLRSNEFALLRLHGMGAWITEFNLKDRTTNRIFAGTWMHGLFASALTLLFLSDSVVEHVDLFNVVGGDTITDAVAGAVFTDAAGFGSTGPATTPWALTATGTVLSLIERALEGAASAHTISFSPNPALPAGGPALIGSVLVGGRSQAVVVNLSDQTADVNVAALFPNGFAFEQITAASLTTPVTGPESVHVTNGSGSGTIALNPHSITRLYE